MTVGTTRVRRGSQRPTWMHTDPFSRAAGNEAINLYRQSGKFLDPWQQLIIRGGLAEFPDASPVHFQVGVIVGRQNGKGEVIECAELSWLFLPSITPVRLITHSAHRFDTSKEAFLRLKDTIESVPDWDAQVVRMNDSHGSEGVELRNGARIHYRTRSGTGGGGRGFTGDKLVFDEAMILDAEPMAALLPTLAARPAAQVWYLASAGSKKLLTGSTHLAKVRELALAREEGLAFYAWESPDDVDVMDKRWWYRTNPGLGIRITERYIRNELKTLGAEQGKRERLGVGDYPTEAGWRLFNAAKWASLYDPTSEIPGDPAVAIDVSPDRRRASVSVCGFNDDRNYHIERIQGFVGLRGIGDYVEALLERQSFCAVVVAQNSQSRGLIRELADRGITAYAATTAEVSEWCGEFFTRVDDTLTVRHGGQQVMEDALAAAVKKTVGGRFVWDLMGVGGDLTPLYSATLALGGLLLFGVHSGTLQVASV